MHTHLGSAHHQAVAHVVAGVAQIHQLHAAQLAEVLLNGQEVGQDLGGVELVGEAVEHGHTGVLSQLLHQILTKAAVLDAVIHPAQDAGGVSDGLLHADLAAGGAQVSGAHAQILRGHLEGAAGTGGGLFENQGNVLALQILVGNAGLLLRLQVRGSVQKLLDLSRGEVQELQKVGMIFHIVSSLYV